MIDKTEIQVFVSCPGDVEAEKKIVEKVCKDLTDSIENYCKVTFRMKEWKSIIGNFGERPQGIINDKIGSYDIYLGIWWMRFGTPTGGINPLNGEEYESGTYEEFVLAFENWKSYKYPDMYLMFKEYRVAKDTELEQQLKVSKFKSEQSPNGWLNSFTDVLQFQSMVHKVLLDKLLKFCFTENKEQKLKIVLENPEISIEQHRISIEPPIGYIPRSVIHFSNFVERKKIPFLELTKEKLSTLIQSKKHIIILGDAGSGKSTELRNLAYLLNEPNSAFFPIYKQLNNYTPEVGFENFLPNYWKTITPNLLVIILDGLDEILPKDFNTVVKQITNFKELNPEIRMVISSRSNFYSLPVNNTPGTLNGFEPYFICDINYYEGKEYYKDKYEESNADNFIHDIHENNLGTLIAKPYFLMVMADIYNSKNMLPKSKKEIYDLFLQTRIENDIKHFITTVEIIHNKQSIMMILEKVALSMETLCKNTIHDNELLQIIDKSELELLQCTTAFKLQDGMTDVWQFEHNNIQEYLTAKALSKLPFDKVIRFISFGSSHKKLIPSWVNTLSFLFSILDIKSDLFKKLLKWLLENEKEVIIKFEPERVSESLRIKIFKEIFNYYKENDIWISSSKFTDKDLAQFGQSKTTINFIIKEIESEDTTRTVLINGLSILGYFDFGEGKIKNKVKTLLMDLIDKNSEDKDFMHKTLYTLNNAKIYDETTLDFLMGKIGNKKNQYYRTPIYLLIYNSGLSEKYLDYLIEGYGLIEDKSTDGRENVYVFGESWNLKECLVSIKSYVGLKKLLEYISDDHRFDYTQDSSEILESVIDNAVELYKTNIAIYNVVLELLQKLMKRHSQNKHKKALIFFDKTGTRTQAFKDIWNTIEDVNNNRVRLLALLYTPEIIEFIADSYNKHDITNQQIIYLYNMMSWEGNPSANEFDKIIKEKTKYEIPKAPYIDHEAIRKKRLNEDFSLLFDPGKFISETKNVFIVEGKAEFTNDDLYKIRTENYQVTEMDDYYPGVILRLLRDFRGILIKESDVMSWFKKDHHFEFYRVELIYNYLLNNKDLSLNAEQSEWLSNWCKENIDKVDFKTALKNNGRGGINIDRKALYIWYFFRKINFELSKEVLLDLLSFDCFEGNEYLGIDYLIEKLEEKDIKDRIIKNLKKGIEDITVFKNHIEYAVDKHLNIVYPLIRKEILNLEIPDYIRIEILDIYYTGTKDVNGIKKILPKLDLPLKRNIIQKLIDSGNKKFVINYLLPILQTGNEDEQLMAANYLVSLQQIEGLNFIFEYIKMLEGNNLPNRLIVSNLHKLTTIEAIPYLIKTLELCYEKKDIRIEHFDSLSNTVFSALYNIALANDDFDKVRKSLEQFIDDHKGIENINYIRLTIERLENQFYMNKVKVFTIIEVKEKLKFLESE